MSYQRTNNGVQVPQRGTSSIGYAGGMRQLYHTSQYVYFSLIPVAVDHVSEAVAKYLMELLLMRRKLSASVFTFSLQENYPTVETFLKSHEGHLERVFQCK